MKYYCKYCKGVFIPCNTCLKIKAYYSWRIDFCTTNCFQEYHKKQQSGGDKMKYDMKNPVRGKIFDNDQMVDIPEFDFSEDINGKMIDNHNTERNVNDFHYLILYREAFKDILQDVYNIGFNDGKNKNKLNKNLTNKKNVV